MKSIRLAATLLLSLCVITSYAQKKQVRTGNGLYEQKKYKDAAAAYEKALAKNPTYTPGLFNLGNALYQQKNYDASRQVMAATAKQAKEQGVKACANYNIGNTYMQEQKWSEAVDAYKQSLRTNPKDEDAKYNLSYALSKLKKQQGGVGKNDKNKDQQDQNKDQNKQDQNKDQKENQDKDQQNKDQPNKDQDKQDQKDEQDKCQQPQPSKISEQQADQLLNALSQEEKKLHDKKEKAVKIKIDKDW